MSLCPDALPPCAGAASPCDEEDPLLCEELELAAGAAFAGGGGVPRLWLNCAISCGVACLGGAGGPLIGTTVIVPAGRFTVTPVLRDVAVIRPPKQMMVSGAGDDGGELFHL